MFVAHIYCAKCQRCIGFRLDAAMMPAVYCMMCESAVTELELERELKHMQWQAAMNKGNARPIR